MALPTKRRVAGEGAGVEEAEGLFDGLFDEVQDADWGWAGCGL